MNYFKAITAALGTILGCFVRDLSLSLCRLPICNQSASNVRKLADILRQGISNHAKELKDAKAMIDGNLVRMGILLTFISGHDE